MLVAAHLAYPLLAFAASALSADPATGAAGAPVSVVATLAIVPVVAIAIAAGFLLTRPPHPEDSIGAVIGLTGAVGAAVALGLVVPMGVAAAWFVGRSAVGVVVGVGAAHVLIVAAWLSVYTLVRNAWPTRALPLALGAYLLLAWVIPLGSAAMFSAFASYRPQEAGFGFAPPWGFWMTLASPGESVGGLLDTLGLRGSAFPRPEYREHVGAIYGPVTYGLAVLAWIALPLAAAYAIAARRAQRA